MTDVAKLQLIEAYHNNCLTDTEQIEFDKLIQEDAAFAAEVEDYQFLLDGFDMLELETFDAQMQSWEEKHQEEGTPVLDLNKQPAGTTGKTRRLNFRRYIAVAAAVVLIAFTPLAYSLLSAPADVYADMFEVPAAMTGTNRGLKATGKEEAKSFALNFYNKEKYQKAAELLTTYINEYGQEEYEAMLYLGISQMKIEQFQKASYNLENVYENAGGYHAQTAQWMFALTQYKLGNKTAAIKIVESIVAKVGHNNIKEAKEFLEKVKK